MANTTGKRIFLGITIAVLLFVIISVAVGLSGGGTGGRIGVVEIEGTISDLKDVMDSIVQFKEDRSIRGVIVRINSPGGAVGPTQEVYSELKKLRSAKKVYISMGSVCASGGYYIATAGDRIYASPSTITGSIGVIMQQAVVEDLMKKLGIQANTLKAGALKDTGSPFRKMTDDEKAYLQGILNSIHDQFIKDVAQGRKLSIEKTRELADGRIYTGLQAKEKGLVDGIGTFYDTLDDMKRVLGVSGKPSLVYAKKHLPFLKWLISSVVEELFFLRDPVEPIKFLYAPRSVP